MTEWERLCDRADDLDNQALIVFARQRQVINTQHERKLWELDELQFAGLTLNRGDKLTLTDEQRVALGENFRDNHVAYVISVDADSKRVLVENGTGQLGSLSLTETLEGRRKYVNFQQVRTDSKQQTPKSFQRAAGVLLLIAAGVTAAALFQYGLAGAALVVLGWLAGAAFMSASFRAR